MCYNPIIYKENVKYSLLRPKIIVLHLIESTIELLKSKKLAQLWFKTVFSDL